MSLAFRAIPIVLALLVGTAALGTGVVGVRPRACRETCSTRSSWRWRMCNWR